MGAFTVATENCFAALNWTGVESSFPAGFPALDPSHVVVTYTFGTPAATITLVRGIHYAATLDPATGMATVLPLSMPAAPGLVTITRNTPALQGTQFANLATFAPDTHTTLHDASALRDAELKRRVGVLELAPVAPGVVSPAMLAVVGAGSIAAALALLGIVQRTALIANTTFYVSTTGNDANNGRSPGTAWLTLQHAYDTICTTYDFRGFGALLQVGPGSFAGIDSDNFPVGQAGAGQFIIQGDVSGGPSGTSWQNTVITGSASGDSFHFGSSTNGGPNILFRYLYCNQSTGHGILATAANTMFQVDVCGFATPGHFNMYAANGALIECVSLTTIYCVGNCASHVNTDNNGRFISQSITVTYLGLPTFSLANYLCTSGNMSIGGITFTNTLCNGKRFSISHLGLIATGTSGSVAYIPGSIAGTATPDSVYD